MDYFKKSLELHKELGGKWEVHSKVSLNTKDDLSIAYTPGVAEVCSVIDKDVKRAYDLTMKGNSVAIVSDGSAVLGLGNIGPEAGLPVMEGKAILFKEFANIDGVPIVLDVHKPKEIIAAVRAIAPTFGGINLEDIKAPECFRIEKELQDLGIPVFHDDQHGTAIVLLAALINSCKLTNRSMGDIKVVINGAGSAGTAIAKMLRCKGDYSNRCEPVMDIIVCDSKGIISSKRDDLNKYKKKLLKFTNNSDQSGSVHDAIKNADCFIGVSQGNLLDAQDIKNMAKDPFIFAMANPIPEIMPDIALAAGAKIVGTGRSDFSNQVNNVLAFPGIFRGALNAQANRITDKMKIAAAHAIADAVGELKNDHILPRPLDKSVAEKVAKAVEEQAYICGVSCL